MYQYAHVLDLLVVNVSVWAHHPTDEEKARYVPEVLIDATGTGVGPRWTYDPGTGAFSPPAPPPEPEP